MRVNTFYPIGEKLVINSTVFLEEKESTRTQAVKLRLRQLIGEAIKNKQQNIGESRLYVEGTFSPVTAIEGTHISNIFSFTCTLLLNFTVPRNLSATVMTRLLQKHFLL